MDSFFSAGKMALKTSFHLLLFFMFVDATPYNITDEPQLNLIQCYDNEWQCEDRCIHKRRVCNQNGTNFCHQDFPISCGDRQRCHKKVSFRQNLMSFYTKATFLLIVFNQQTWLRNLLARKTSIECYIIYKRICERFQIHAFMQKVQMNVESKRLFFLSLASCYTFDLKMYFPLSWVNFLYVWTQKTVEKLFEQPFAMLQLFFGGTFNIYKHVFSTHFPAYQFICLFPPTFPSCWTVIGLMQQSEWNG